MMTSPNNWLRPSFRGLEDFVQRSNFGVSETVPRTGDSQAECGKMRCGVA
jgi:hypothetical protein